MEWGIEYNTLRIWEHATINYPHATVSQRKITRPELPGAIARNTTLSHCIGEPPPGLQLLYRRSWSSDE
jgi:hypothetical protein